MSIPFAIAISIWHAIASVVLPVFFTHYLFPEKKGSPWLPKWLSILLGLGLTGIGIANFLNPSIRIEGTLPALFLLLSLMLILIALGFHYGKRALPEQKKIIQTLPLKPLRPFFIGFLTIFYFGFNVVAGLHIPVIIFLCCLIGSVYYYHKKYSPRIITQKDCLLFGLGFYVQQAVLAILLRLIGGDPSAIASITPLFIFIAITIFSALTITKRGSSP